MFDYILLTFYNSIQRNGDVSPESQVRPADATRQITYVVAEGAANLDPWTLAESDRYCPRQKKCTIRDLGGGEVESAAAMPGGRVYEW